MTEVDRYEGGTGWLLVGLQRGVVLPVVYAALWAAFGALFDWVSGSSAPVAPLAVWLGLFGVPVGALAGVLLGAVCALVDRWTGGVLGRRAVAVRVVMAVAAVSAVLAAAAFEFWVVFVGGPAALAVASFWVWPLPARPQRTHG